ncbi:RNA methyltransferase [Muricauda sp. JGD-17]|uniref:RNA methyltransferase n=1 Tax=Flagellimonas ochracea TaxID=2696472 RepID=A0A964WY15_9FLAO|nr:RNA methyltransferase [Allomuricauda ochracea]NAY92437.1 RNA methyltransferase [Allomuricauda ochracea]
MVTKNQIKLVVSLQQKKYRTRHGLFMVEGAKTVNELLEAGCRSYQLVVDTAGKIEKFPEAEVVSSAVIKQMGSQVNPSGVLGVFYMPETDRINYDDWIVVVDAVRDPGNLGTIVRLCDWFGVKNLICSNDTVDCYNPKVLQATMGSIARVNIKYVDLAEFLQQAPLPIYGAFTEGECVYDKVLPEKGILVMGNEANGISTKIEALITERIAIPQFGTRTTESLNVATATAILLNEIRRS